MALNARLLYYCLLKRHSALFKGQSICHPSKTSRKVHTSTQLGKSVKLSYHVHKGNYPNQPVVLMHGLLGSGKNFDGIAKRLVKSSGRTVVTVDARNHGNSGHSGEMNYEHMALDIVDLLHELKATSCTPVGHSFGGRTAMTLALSRPDLVDKLVVIDVSPLYRESNTEVLNYVLALQKFEMPDMTLTDARKFASLCLRSVIPDRAVRNFILTNLVEKDGHLMWRINIDSILKNFPALSKISVDKPPYVAGSALFIGGSLSNYIRKEDYPVIEQLFPTSEVHIVEGAGHWIHYDKPKELLSLLIPFLTSVK